MNVDLAHDAERGGWLTDFENIYEGQGLKWFGPQEPIEIIIKFTHPCWYFAGQALHLHSLLHIILEGLPLDEIE